MLEIFPGIKLGDWITFDVYPVSIIGTSYSEGVELIAVLDTDAARAFFDPHVRHQAVSPYLQAPVEVGYPYIKVRHANGADDVVGLPWIDIDSIKGAGTSNLSISYTNLSTLEIDGLLAALTSMGYPPHQKSIT